MLLPAGSDAAHLLPTSPPPRFRGSYHTLHQEQEESPMGTSCGSGVFLQGLSSGWGDRKWLSTCQDPSHTQSWSKAGAI